MNAPLWEWPVEPGLHGAPAVVPVVPERAAHAPGQVRPDPGQAVLTDEEGRAIAGELRRQRPDWLIMWGCYSRRFVAFPLFAATERVIVTTHYPDALVPRLDEAEHRWRIRPDTDDEKMGQA